VLILRGFKVVPRSSARHRDEDGVALVSLGGSALAWNACYWSTVAALPNWQTTRPIENLW
jgi:hypothetical protein